MNRLFAVLVSAQIRQDFGYMRLSGSTRYNQIDVLYKKIKLRVQFLLCV